MKKNNNLKLTHKLSSLLLENGYHLSNIFTSDWPNLLHSVAFYTNEIYPREDILYLSYLITMKFPSYDDEYYNYYCSPGQHGAIGWCSNTAPSIFHTGTP